MPISWNFAVNTETIRIFGYRSIYVRIQRTILIMAFLVLFLTPFLIFAISPTRPPIVIFPMSFVGVGALLYAIIVSYQVSAPISLGRNGVTTFFAGRKSKYFDWEKVDEIQKARVYSNFFNVYYYMFRIVSNSGYIEATDRIDDFPEFIDLLNYYRDKYGIPVYEVSLPRKPSDAKVPLLKL
jgi:hypothetical protein